ncbi:MAG TPA: tetratricopeptide repeat protein, partial [Chitinophagaceae bacterium]|nr:tetratricopeptide repeat protein [Chitinophagaceae bacterium]
MRWNDNVCAECPNGISAKPFIGWNIFLHILNAVLVFYVTFLLSRRNWFVGIFCGIVFSLHPMHTESVAWVSERKDVLYVFFYLAGLLFYNRYLDELFSKDKKPQYKWLIITMACFVFSCLSKAMAVSFPFAMMLLYFWKDKSASSLKALRNTFSNKRILEYLPFFAVAVFFGLMAFSIQSGKDFGGMLQASEKSLAVNEFRVFTIFQRFQFASYGFCMYIYKFFVPSGFSALHPYPPQTEYESNPIYIILLITSIIVLAAAALSIKRTRLFVFGIGFYFITVVFVLQFVSVGVAIIADRYTYLPFVGLSLIVALLIQKLPRNIRYVAMGMTALTAIIWLLQTRSQVDKWQNSDTLLSQVITRYPLAEQAYSIRGNYYGKQAGIFAMKGDTAMQRRYIEKAEQDFTKAIQLQSNRVDVYEGMGNIQGMKGNRDEALNMYNKAIELDPKRSSAYVNRGVTYDLSGNYQEALKDFSKAIELDTRPVHFLYRGMLRQKVGDIEGAKTDYRRVLQIAPNNDEAAKRLEALGG